MHRKHQIAALVYDYLFPNPRPEDPTSFSAHLSKNLVGEVRIETATFYGSLDTIEARYPGLNYSYPPHRKRLGRFPHHARLFRAFDDLGLTEHEIATFCRWEGTLWARERYERDEGIKVQDTTGMEIVAWVDNRKLRASDGSSGGSGSGGSTPACIKVKTDIEVEIEHANPAALAGAAESSNSSGSSTSTTTPNRRRHSTSFALPPLAGLQRLQQLPQRSEDRTMRDAPPAPTATASGDGEHGTQDDEDEELLDTDEEVESIGLHLNQRLIEAADMRNRGVDNVVMDPEWEQYLKDVQESEQRGIQPSSAAHSALASTSAFSNRPPPTLPLPSSSAAR